jgi:hypothetical protein
MALGTVKLKPVCVLDFEAESFPQLIRVVPLQFDIQLTIWRLVFLVPEVHLAEAGKVLNETLEIELLSAESPGKQVSHIDL